MQRYCKPNRFSMAARAKWVRNPTGVVVLAGDGMWFVPSEPVPELPCHLSKGLP